MNSLKQNERLEKNLKSPLQLYSLLNVHISGEMDVGTDSTLNRIKYKEISFFHVLLDVGEEHKMKWMLRINRMFTHKVSLLSERGGDTRMCDYFHSYSY